jgi:hypothetical protein
MARKKRAPVLLAAPAHRYLQLLNLIWQDKSALKRQLRDHSIDDPDVEGETLLHVACNEADFVQ